MRGMIALRKSKAFLALVRPPEPPTVDVERITADSRGITFAPGALENAERLWLVDGGALTGGIPVTDGVIRLKAGPGLHTVFIAGAGGWSQLTVGAGVCSVRPATPRLDGGAIGFSEAGFYCREPAVIGYHRLVITVRHPVGGAERKTELPIDVQHGTFDTNTYLGLSAGDRVTLELHGADGKLVRSFVFPRAPDRWKTYSLDELTRS